MKLFLTPVFLLIAVNFGFSQIEQKPSSKWMMVTRSCDSLHLFDQKFHHSPDNPWDLIRENGLINKLKVYKENAHTFNEVLYSEIPEKEYIIESNGDTLRTRLKSEDFFKTMQSVYPIQAVDGRDSFARINDVLQFVYPPTIQTPVEWEDIRSINVRFDWTNPKKYVATYLGFNYSNGAFTKELWFSISDLKETITSKPFLIWIEKIERTDSVGFQYMQINSEYTNNAKPVNNHTCLNAAYRFVSVRKNEHNELLFHSAATSNCLINEIASIISKGNIYKYGIYEYTEEWYGNDWQNHFNEELYNLRFLKRSVSDYFEFRYGSDIPLSTVYGEDSILITNGIMQFVYPPDEIYPFNLSDWNEIKIRESYDEKTNSYIPSGISFVISKEDVTFELMRIDLTKIKQDFPKLERYDWFQFLMTKEYTGFNYCQIPFKEVEK